MTAVYKLNQGWSPDGAAVHPVDHVANYSELADAQAAAEQAAGRPLTWAWLVERHAWRAVTGYEQAAEIEPCQRVTGISVSAGTMP